MTKPRALQDAGNGPKPAWCDERWAWDEDLRRHGRALRVRKVPWRAELSMAAVVLVLSLVALAWFPLHKSVLAVPVIAVALLMSRVFVVVAGPVIWGREKQLARLHAIVPVGADEADHVLLRGVVQELEDGHGDIAGMIAHGPRGRLTYDEYQTSVRLFAVESDDGVHVVDATYLRVCVPDRFTFQGHEQSIRHGDEVVVRGRLRPAAQGQQDAILARVNQHYRGASGQVIHGSEDDPVRIARCLSPYA